MVTVRPTTPLYPTHPSEIALDVPLDTLTDAYHRHALALLGQHHGLGEPLTDGQVASHALAALTYQHALAQRALCSRWVTVWLGGPVRIASPDRPAGSAVPTPGSRSDGTARSGPARRRTGTKASPRTDAQLSAAVRELVEAHGAPLSGRPRKSVGG